MSSDRGHLLRLAPDSSGKLHQRPVQQGQGMLFRHRTQGFQPVRHARPAADLAVSAVCCVEVEADVCADADGTVVSSGVQCAVGEGDRLSVLAQLVWSQ